MLANPMGLCASRAGRSSWAADARRPRPVNGPYGDMNRSLGREIGFQATVRAGKSPIDRGRNAGCPAPPAQIPAGALTHEAPALGGDGEALVGPRVPDDGSWPVQADESVNCWPVRAVFLRAPAQGAQEQAFGRLNKRFQGCGGTRNGKVVQPSIDDPSEPSCYLVLAQVHAFTQLVLDPSEGPCDALPRRVAPQPEFTVSGLAAEVRHSQKFEGFRFALTAVLPILIREPSELDEPGFYRGAESARTGLASPSSRSGSAALPTDVGSRVTKSSA